MKQCPECKTTYTDASLSFCLSDGSRLVEVSGEEETVVRNAARDPLRVDLAHKFEPTIIAKQETASGSNSSATWIKVVVAAVILGLVAIGALGLAGAIVYYNTGGGTPMPTPVPTTPRPTASATPDLEKERLQDEIANIKKQLDEKKNSSDIDETDDERGSSITATVDSPKDGFLALRSRPDAEHGERLAKVPHGAEVEILNCEKTAVTIGGRNGRWCQVEYNGINGWVFDAWLEY